MHIQSREQEIYPIVEYENLPFFCTSCRTLGHEIKDCKAEEEPQEKTNMPILPAPRVVKDKPKRCTLEKNALLQPHILMADIEHNSTDHVTEEGVGQDSTQNNVTTVLQTDVQQCSTEAPNIPPQQNLSRLGTSLEQILEETDDLLDVIVSDSEILLNGQSNSTNLTTEEVFLDELSNTITATVSSEWKRELNDSSVVLQRRMSILEASEKSTDQPIQELEDPKPISRRGRTEKEMLATYSHTSDRVTRSSHLQPSSSQ